MAHHPKVDLYAVEHVTVGGGKDLVCHWPRQGGLYRWGDELLAAYIESPCAYERPSEVGHGQDGIWGRGYVRLRRSLDRGRTWTDAGKLFDNSLSVEEQRRVLHLDEYGDPYTGPIREPLDMHVPDAVFLMGRAWCGEERQLEDGRVVRDNVAYCFRSPDRGHLWESVPSIMGPNHTRTVVELANNTMWVGSAVYAWLVGYGGIEGVSSSSGETYSPQLYASEDHGITWQFHSEIYCDPHRRIAASYPQVIPLPSGRWLCTLGCWMASGRAFSRWTSVVYSEDQGLNWTAPRRIHAWSVSPFPLLLSDGRLLIVFMRRNPDPTGLYAILSEDEGATWSEPSCLRDDLPSAGPRGVVDGGYPVAVEMDDGRIFVAYYWQHDDPDVPWHGGRKFIDGTFFRM